MRGDYIIKDIKAKNGGTLKHIHTSAIGCECLIADLERGERSLLRVKPDYDPDSFHRIHTSTVLNYTASEDGNNVTIETLNTVYYLERCNFDDSFSGINTYTFDVAKEKVTEFLGGQNDAFFSKYRTTRDAVMQNDDLISRCATIHHRLIKDAGLDYAWACDFACANALQENAAFISRE